MVKMFLSFTNVFAKTGQTDNKTDGTTGRNYFNSLEPMLLTIQADQFPYNTFLVERDKTYSELTLTSDFSLSLFIILILHGGQFMKWAL